MNIRYFPLLLTSVVSAFVLCGCEVTSKSHAVSIDPDSATLHKGQSVGLHATGGDDYTWSLSDRTLGTLSSSHGANVVYTSIVAPPVGSPVVQTVTVTADLGLSGTTNSVITEQTATAFITHVSGVVRTNTDTSTVTVFPATATLVFGESAAFQAFGDTAYSWTLETPAWGVLSRSSGGEVTYTSQYSPPVGKAVVQRITVLGSNGGIGRIFVTQTAIVLQLIPDTAQVSKKNDYAEFVVTGGGQYAWALSQPTWGTLSAQSGDSVTYTCLHTNSTASVELQTITVTDVSGATVKGTIYHMPQ